MSKSMESLLCYDKNDKVYVYEVNGSREIRTNFLSSLI